MDDTRQRLIGNMFDVTAALVDQVHFRLIHIEAEDSTSARAN